MNARSGRIITLAVLLAISPSAVRAAEDDDIRKAIKNGVEYLKGVHKPEPNYAGGSHGMGSAALAGLALLEAGVPADDPSLRNISQYVHDNALAQTRTYELSLTIMFLDRLGDPVDRPVIQLLGIRLAGGQGGNGGYTYDCGNPFSDGEIAQLKQALIGNVRLVNDPNKKPAEAKKEPPKLEKRPDIQFDETFPDVNPLKKGNEQPAAKDVPSAVRPPLHPLAEKFARLINLTNAGVANRVKNGGDGDNSNTQFATLGLWIGRKHGVPCDGALSALEQRFRTGQADDGGWNYKYSYRGGGTSTPAMTCAGLIAFAVSHGSKLAVLRNRPDVPGKAPAKGDLEDDEAIKRALKYLGTCIREAKGEAPADAFVRGKGKGKGRFKVDDLNSNLYFLWSLERVAVIFGLATIGNHDWYTWGADGLVGSQRADGSWDHGRYHGAHPEISTSFALLFLSRANVARDLTAALQGKVRDPGSATLKVVGADVPEKPSPMPTVKAPVTPRPDLIAPPKAEVDPFEAEAARLSSELLMSTGRERSQLLAKIRDAKGGVNSEALAKAAARATGEFQSEVRNAFAQRLTRMTTPTLRGFLKDQDREVRLAAATAGGAKGDKQLAPDLIDALNDRDGPVIQAARSSLKALSGKDFGPEFAAESADQAKSILGWKTWWATQNK